MLQTHEMLFDALAEVVPGVGRNRLKVPAMHNIVEMVAEGVFPSAVSSIT